MTQTKRPLKIKKKIIKLLIFLKTEAVRRISDLIFFNMVFECIGDLELNYYFLND